MPKNMFRGNKKQLVVLVALNRVLEMFPRGGVWQGHHLKKTRAGKASLEKGRGKLDHSAGFQMQTIEKTKTWAIVTHLVYDTMIPPWPMHII